MSYYNNSISQALSDLFPDIGINKLHTYKAVTPRSMLLYPPSSSLLCTLFSTAQQTAVPWDKAETRRKFFERYANEHSFDYLIPTNWYEQPIGDILSYRVSPLSFSQFTSSPSHLSHPPFPPTSLLYLPKLGSSEGDCLPRQQCTKGPHRLVPKRQL